MTLSVCGAGFFGTWHPLSLAQIDHVVIGQDIDVARIPQMAIGTATFREPDASGPLQTGHGGGRLTVTVEPAELAETQVHFPCVGTPRPKVVNESDLPFLPTVVEALLPHLRSAASRTPV